MEELRTQTNFIIRVISVIYFCSYYSFFPLPPPFSVLLVYVFLQRLILWEKKKIKRRGGEVNNPSSFCVLLFLEELYSIQREDLLSCACSSLHSLMSYFRMELLMEILSISTGCSIKF